MNHERFEELVIAHAVDGTLDALGARELIPHLTVCEECRVMLRDLEEAATDLAFSGPAVLAPPELEERIVTAVRASSPARVVRVGRARRMLTVAAAAAVLALGSTSVMLYNSVQDGNANERRIVAALDILSEPRASLAQLSASRGKASGIVAIAPDGRGVLIVDGLQPAPPGKVHELWLIADGQAHPIDVFDVDAERIIVPLQIEGSGFDAAAVTIERGPSGSPVPTGDMLLTGQIA